MREQDKDTSKAIRSAPLQARSKKRVELILASALSLLRERGIEDITTNDIADHAHIPIGSLYRYFPNKESILAALTNVYVDDVCKVFRDVGKHPLLLHLSWDEILSMMIHGWVDYSNKNGPFNFLYAERANPRLHAQNRATWQRFVDEFVAVLLKRCPALSTGQALLCFNMSYSAAQIGVDDNWLKAGGDQMYHEAISMAALYMMRACPQSGPDDDILA